MSGVSTAPVRVAAGVRAVPGRFFYSFRGDRRIQSSDGRGMNDVLSKRAPFSDLCLNSLVQQVFCKSRYPFKTQIVEGM